MYVNNPDSTWFSMDEKENAAFARFNEENSRQKQKIGLLQQFLMEYDQPESEFYQQGKQEYETRREAYNKWIDSSAKEDSKLFASSLYRFSYLPPISFEGNEQDRLFSLIAHYFDGIDFNDHIIIKTAQMNEWMNGYVNLHGQMATSIALRDSLIPAAAYKAIEKAKTGHPQVYGWMVDYFYRGFESNNIPQGMKVLQPYLDDPACLTSKRMEIERRLKGMETLVPGIKAPDFTLSDDAGKEFTFSKYRPLAKNLLIIFWSADCAHCMEEINQLYPWQQQAGISDKLEVIAISLDESATEVAAWERKIKELKGWKHLRAKEGINSPVANDYFILATPVMILVDSKTRNIIEMPASVLQLQQLLK
jgi:thiol-disulfide isomerase/thioredoxin